MGSSMARRAAFIVTILLTAFLAGCTASDPAPAPGAPDAPREPSTTTPPASPPAERPPASPARPTITPATDAGDIRGPFEETWIIDLPQANARGMNVYFNLTGAEAGAPPTARINLMLHDPAGNLVKTDTIGLGANADAIAWEFGNDIVQMAGAYTLFATKANDAAAPVLPSGGLAKYTMYAYPIY